MSTSRASLGYVGLNRTEEFRDLYKDLEGMVNETLKCDGVEEKGDQYCSANQTGEAKPQHLEKLNTFDLL